MNYCRRILHALAAISDYPTRKSVQLESDELVGFFQALAQALDDLANSLVAGTEPRRLSDLSSSGAAGKHFAPGGSRSSDEAAENRAPAPAFYHLKNAVDLTLATREAISRLVESAVSRKEEFVTTDLQYTVWQVRSGES